MTQDLHANVPPLKVSDASALENQSIVIIGAGASGLFCAYTLAFLGFHNFTILEASDDFGGRVQELYFIDEVPLDAGPEWIHVHPQVLQDLLLFSNQTGDVETITYQPQSFGIYRKGKSRKRNWIRFFYQEWKFERSTWYSYLSDYICPHVRENIKYNAVVSEISYLNDTVMVATTDGRNFEADKVVISTPAATLQAGDITFIPSLPNKKLTAIKNVHMEDGLKVWFEFNQRFYPDFQIPTTLRKYIFSYESGEEFYFDVLFGKKVDGRHVLGYFHVGQHATKLVKMDEDELISMLLKQLDDMFDGKATKHYIRHFVMNWSKQPHIKGAYSMNIQDRSWTLKELQRPVKERLYFCGEHTNDDDQATVHGAAMTGRRVAQDIIIDAGGSERRRRLLR